MSRSSGFLNTLNPISRPHNNQLQNLHAFDQATELLEEDDEPGNTYDIPLQASNTLVSPRNKSQNTGVAILDTRDGNDNHAGTDEASDASDPEVPHSFMVETSPAARRKALLPHTRSQRRHPAGSNTTRSDSQRNRASAGTTTSASGPLLPTTYPIASRTPHPDNIEEEDENEDYDHNVPLLRTSNMSTSTSHRRKDKRKRRVIQDTDSSKDAAKRGLDEYQQALWRWVNVYNVDEYLQEVYYYYANSGFTSIAVSRALNLLTVGFVIAFTTFLWGCIDYSKLPSIRGGKGGRLDDVVVPRCLARLPPVPALFLLLFSAFYGYQLLTFFLSLARLYQMRAFYKHLLKIPDEDLSTLPWSTVVSRISAIRDENPITAIGSLPEGISPEQGTSTAKLDAHDIANRIMRQENYLIALFNKDLLDLQIPLPKPMKDVLALIGLYQESTERDEKGQETKSGSTTLTRALEWNLRFCLMDFLFDRSGRVKDVFLKERSRDVLIKGLQTRFIFMGCLNALFVPFIIPYLLIYSFFRYFEEAQKNPSSISGRRYTPYAEWKFREFNELPHLFTRRLDTSYPTANMYLDQYPNTTISHIARFVSFVAGSFAGVLILGSLLDPELVLNFEITPGKTVLFWIGVFGGILAVSRGMIIDRHLVYDPDILMKEVIRHTHYMPAHWKGNLHSQKVNKEFSQLFTMKAMVFVQELLSVVLNPLILTISLPACAPQIIDFFREFTVHVDSLGYVCSFAVFDFKRHGNIKFGAPSFGESQGNSGGTENRDSGWQDDERLQSKDGKMEKSFLAFKAAHPEWMPTDPTGSLYLERLRDMHQDMNHPPQGQNPGKRGTIPTFGGASGMHRSTLAERSELYERALAQSMANARARRGVAGSLQMTAAASGTGRRIVSHHSGGNQGETSHMQRDESGQVDPGFKGIREKDDDRAEDGGIGSELGDSYVDDVRVHGGRIILGASQPLNSGQRGQNRGFNVDQKTREEEEEEAEELANGGVLGLLAQIYDRKRPVM